MLKLPSARPLIVAGIALLGLYGAPLPAWAQNGATRPSESSRIPHVSSDVLVLPGIFDRLGLEPVSQLPEGSSQYRVQISIRNIQASIIAYWLDPAHQLIPMSIKYGQALAFGESGFDDMPRQPGNGNGPRGLKLPAGISSIVSIDPQNALLVTGTKEGITALAPLVVSADVPLEQYEIEAQFLSMSRADLPLFGLKSEKKPYLEDFGAVVLAPANISPKITELVVNKRAKILTAPRITVIDGLGGVLKQSVSTPFVMDQEATKQSMSSQDENKEATKVAKGIADQSSNDSSVSPVVAYVTTEIGLKAVLHHLKGDLVSLSVRPTLKTRTLSVTTTVHDAQPFVIQMTSPADKEQIVVVVTPRHIRRIGDE